MRMMLNILTVTGLLLAAGAALSACNTAEGFGRDMETAGKKIQDAL